jgi:SAM-dependent methyltransferase
MSSAAVPNPLREYFRANRGRLLHKWDHYFDVYHRHFARFRGQPITVLEIGLFHGGSLAMWRDYFGPQARIVGVDIEPRAQMFAGINTEVYIGDQSDREFLAAMRRRCPRVDVLIDDGGHRMWEQIATFEELYPVVADGGVYLCEDLHTSYWKEWGGGLANPYTFINYSKTLVDRLNAFHSRDPNSLEPDDFTRSTASLHYYDSILVIEKQRRAAPVDGATGTPSFALRPEEAETLARIGWRAP